MLVAEYVLGGHTRLPVGDEVFHERCWIRLDLYLFYCNIILCTNICSSFNASSIESWVISKIYSLKLVTYSKQIGNWLVWISHDLWRISANFLDTYLIGLIWLMWLTRNLYQQIFHIFWCILAYNYRSANEVFPDADTGARYTLYAHACWRCSLTN